MNRSIILMTILVYLAGMIGIGFYYSKKDLTSDEGFFLGNRKLGPLVAAMSAEASDMSSYLLMGLPGLAYLSGLADVGWTEIGLALGTYLNWLIVAKRLRRYSTRLGAITVPDYFSRRFNDTSKLISCVAALIIVIFFIPYTASGFKAVGTLFSSLFGMDYHLAMALGAIVIIGYTVLGGFLAVSTTDLIQSIVMTLALIVIVVFSVGLGGGMDVVLERASRLPGYLSMTRTYDISSGSRLPYTPLNIVSTMAWGLGYFGMPHILLRFMAIKREEDIKASRRIASVWVVVSMFTAIVIGIVGYSCSLSGFISTFTTSSESETVIIRLAGLLSQRGILRAVMAGLVMAGILACTMSTADSQLLAAASSVSKDLMQDFFHVRMTEKQSMRAARITVAAIALIALFLAWNPDSSVFTIVSFAWAGFGGSFGPLMLLSLFWRRTTKQGALAGMICGGATIFIWKYLVRPLGGAWNIYELLPAFLIAGFTTIIVSLLTKAPDSLVTDEFDAVVQDLH